MARVPIILYDTAYWGPMVAFMRDVLAETFQTISVSDLKLITVVDSVEEVLAVLAKKTMKKPKTKKL